MTVTAAAKAHLAKLAEQAKQPKAEAPKAEVKVEEKPKRGRKKKAEE